jgi:trehalose-phosphatase
MSTSLFDSLSEIAERVIQARHLLLCAGFDGTLTPLRKDPDQVSVPVLMQRVLSALASSPRISLAILSGRERTDLQTRVGIPGLVYAGNHGLEISGPGFVFLEPSALERTELVKGFAADLRSNLKSISGVIVEDKGLTITVHYRQVAEAESEEVRRIVHAALASSSHPFLLTSSEKTYEIRPRVYWNKGNAVAWIKERIQRPDALLFYLGDDATDEDAFAVLPDSITIKVGEATETAAKYYVPDVQGVLQFLEWLENLLRESDPPWRIPENANESTLKAAPP